MEYGAAFLPAIPTCSLAAVSVAIRFERPVGCRSLHAVERYAGGRPLVQDFDEFPEVLLPIVHT